MRYIEETTISFLLFLWHFIYTSVSVYYRRNAHYSTGVAFESSLPNGNIH